MTAIPVIRCALWKRVSTDQQDADNQDADLAQFVSHHGYQVAREWTLADSAWKGGKGGPKYQAASKEVLEAAHKGEFAVLLVWRLDRIIRGEGAEGALRLIRQLRERGCVLVSVTETWLTASPEVQDVLVAFAGWMAQMESDKRSERIRAGIARRKAEGRWVGRKPGARDRRPRRRSPYVASWEDGGARREAHENGKGAVA
jgi:DNA invertase Pin-like site-specific DNA recombinase